MNATPGFTFDWTVNVGEIISFICWMFVAVFGGAKFYFMFRENPPHKHVINGKLANRIGQHDQIIYPKGMEPR